MEYKYQYSVFLYTAAVHLQNAKFPAQFPAKFPAKFPAPDGSVSMRAVEYRSRALTPVKKVESSVALCQPQQCNIEKIATIAFTRCSSRLARLVPGHGFSVFKSGLTRAMGSVSGEGNEGAEAHGFDYDLVVIGGGSGGLACSKEAAKLGKKVACMDFVKPTPKGTQWGLGGTCVNVGCIPKKLMHQAGLVGEWMKDAPHFGWKVHQDGHDWAKLVTSVGEHIGSLNWGYRVALRDASVKYINARGQFTGPHTLSCTDKKGKVSLISSHRFVIAVGGRPRYPGVPGDKEHCITSDDIFWLPTPPGKTLLVGASYIALETAGFLTALGFPVTVMARSIFLRGFDQEIAEQIAGHMERHGTRMLRPAVPASFEAAEGGKVKVVYLHADTGEETEEVFDTVVLATGRDAETKDLNLEAAGVHFNPSNGKIMGPNEQTNVDHIFAIGDVLDTRQELTPVAVQAGVLLARRLYAGGTKAMDYNLVPTTVFTPLEYGAVGMSEEAAVEAYGGENVEVYHSHFKPLEWVLNHTEKDGVAEREDNACYAKLVCNKSDDERVVGLHILGPNAGEVTQGYAVAMKVGATKDDFDGTLGIHPTVSEEFTIMRITKASGQSPLKSGC